MGKDAEKNNTVHLIDFGLAELTGLDSSTMPSSSSGNFRGAFKRDDRVVGAAAEEDENSNDEDNVSDKCDSALNIKGTLTFSSISAMKNEVCYAKDDLESLAYSLAYLLQNQVMIHDSVSNSFHSTQTPCYLDTYSCCAN